MTALALRGNRCECTACLQPFNSTSTFDRHRVGAFECPDSPGARRCLSPSEMAAKGWLHNPAGFWIRAARPAVRNALEGPCSPPAVLAEGAAS